jgi:CRP/FNR family cyclic AMP-dependent transcriptional regulator
VPDETQSVTHWSPADWAALVESGIRRTYLPGQYLLRQGDDGSWIVALIKGRVRVTYHAASGSEVLLAIRGPGDLLGEFGYGDREPRSASVIAIEPCMGSLVTDSRFTAWMATHQNHRRLDRYILAKTREAAKVTWQLARCRPAQRLASLLLAVVTAGRGQSPEPLTVPMSQDEIARGLGLARSSITPVLAEWKRRNIVSISRSHITVLDLEAIRREL